MNEIWDGRKINEDHDINYARKLIKECKETQNPYLDIGRCGITDLNDLPELFDCTHLETLILSNEWWDICKKKKFKSQNFGDKNILKTIPNDITKISNLRKLICTGRGTKYGWQIKDISHLGKLKNLEFLELSNNLIEKLAGLTLLRNLIALHISHNNIKDIRPLKNLKNIKYLYISNNYIKNIKALSKLKTLSHLKLSSNDISNITHISNLENLEFIRISYNSIREMNIQLNYKKLYFLDISYNFISELSGDFIKSLDQKKENNIRFYIEGNPLESPPIEIIKQGIEAALDWFAAVKEKFNEVKVILIGDGGAGKTSLLRRLQTGEFIENEAQTDGINIKDIDFSDNKQFKEYEDLHPYKAHFWDFGGQEILNSTHQLFLTLRSIYIIVLNARKDENVENQIQKRVKEVRANGGNSPIIIVANQIDINPGFGFVNENQLRDEYPQIVGFVKVSSKSGFNFDKLKELLEDTIPRAELVNSEIDVKWIKLKDKLLEIIEDKRYLDEETFIDVCNDTGITDENRRKNAISYFNDVGLLLHFENMMIDYYVLDPLWITYGVYQILTSQCVAEFNGIVPIEKLSFILNDEEDKNKNYRSTREVNLRYKKPHGRFLIEALKRFKLCYCTEDNSKFVIPNHLKTTEPKELIESIKSDPESITFVYKYDYMPSYIIPNLMVNFHKYLKHEWRTGFIIEQKNAKAHISAYKNKVTISACGELHAKITIMRNVRTYLEKINSNITPEPEGLIPLTDIDDYVSYEELIYLQKEGETKYSKYKNKKTHKFNIHRLLNGIEPINKSSESDAKLDKIIGITEKTRENTEHIIELMNIHMSFILNELALNTNLSKEIVRAMNDMLDKEFEVGEELVNSLMDEIKKLVSLSHGKLSKQLEDAYNDLSKTKKLSVKLKGGIPLLSLIGFNVEVNYDISQWYHEHSADLMKIGYSLPI